MGIMYGRGRRQLPIIRYLARRCITMKIIVAVPRNMVEMFRLQAGRWASETLRGYAFAYDGLSRLTSASYLLGGVSNSNNSVSGITYDKHGNMRTIQRRGKITASTYGVIDNLTMAYSGNQLASVTDAGSTVTLAESNDFKKGSTAATQYFYNRNGAMDKDLNKNISDISYNLLNLPSKVTIGGVAHKYTYSVDGRKAPCRAGYN